MPELSPGEIYFVRELDPNTQAFTQFVKIGLVNENENRNSFDRLLDHQTGNPRALKLHKDQAIKTLAVSRVESMLHSKYVELRISGEWFEFLDTDSIENAYQFALALAQQVDQEVEAVNQAIHLSEVVDNGQIIQPTSEIEKLATAILLAKEEANRVKRIHSLIMSSMQEAKDEGLDVSGAVDERAVTRTKFNVEALQTDNPELYSSYVITTTRVGGQFRFDAGFKKSVVLDLEVAERLQKIEGELEVLIAAKELKKINEIKLQLISSATELAWQIDVLDAKLRLAVGENKGIEGICTWGRASKIEEKFDQRQFKKHHEDLFLEYSSEGSTSTHLRAKRKKG
jgi:hypothetical protein